jgi:cytoskeletal protein CcmA (bactofilin family)
MGDKINTLIGQDISLIGNIYYKGVIHIEGSIEGSLIANKDEDSKLYINKSSTVKGYVDAKNIAINGKVSGNVYVYGLLQLGSEAFIIGDIYYKSIEMEVGAKIDGRLVICSKDEEIDLHKIDIESISNSNTINNN